MATAFSYRSKAPVFSDSDSDDSDKECLNWKRVTKNETEAPEKVPILPLPVEPSPVQATNSLKRKRNTIWSEVLQDQMMSETLTHCGIENKPKGYGERGAESYDYRLGKRAREEEKYDDSDEDMLDGEKCQPFKRFKSDRFVELDPPGVKVAHEIVKALKEEKRYLIFRVVKHVGIDKATELLRRTLEIEENGGMMIQNQARRRLPGGVYFHLLKSDPQVEKEAIDKIFEGELNSYQLKEKYAELKKLKKKRKNKKRSKKGKKGGMEFSISPIVGSPASSEDENTAIQETAHSEQMEEDIAVSVPVDNSNVEANSAVNKDSDLEEGECSS